MGGCASRPKDLDLTEDAPEAPTTPKKAEGEGLAQEESNKEGGESDKKEEPLVDLSEPKEEEKDESPQTKTAPAAAAAAEAETVEAQPEEKAAETAAETKEAAKEEAKRAEQPIADPSSEDKSDAPLITV